MNDPCFCLIQYVIQVYIPEEHCLTLTSGIYLSRQTHRIQGRYQIYQEYNHFVQLAWNIPFVISIPPTLNIYSDEIKLLDVEPEWSLSWKPFLTLQVSWTLNSGSVLVHSSCYNRIL